MWNGYSNSYPLCSFCGTNEATWISYYMRADSPMPEGPAHTCSWCARKYHFGSSSSDAVTSHVSTRWDYIRRYGEYMELGDF